MSVLKMFFCIVSETQASEITIHRDLNSIYTLWETEKSDDKVGIIHIGFIRPKVPSYDDIQHSNGDVLVSASVKWALPEGYNTSNNAAYEHNKLPLFQLIKGFGYDIVLDDDKLFSQQPDIDLSANADSNHTIASAALEVLESVAKPMSKEEIYGYIIERGLFQFGAKKPINVLNVELNRHCEGTSYSQASSSKFFGKNKAGLFFALSTVPKEVEGWLKELQESNVELTEACMNSGIFNEKSYFKNKQFMSDTQIRELELIRYQTLKRSINIEDPSELIPLLPTSILEAHITQLGLTVRTSNVFNVQSIFKLKDAIGYSLEDMMKWSNFGKKSAKDLCELLDASVEKLSYMLPVNSGDSNTAIINVNEEEITEAPNFEHVSKTPLKIHFENSLSLLKTNERTILEGRTGYNGAVKTLEEMGAVIGVTRERVRQIQKKNVEKIIKTEFWDDCIAIKIGELLLSREQPLYLEMLEVEDAWFSGFIGNYQHLAAIIGLFSENQIKILRIEGSVIISRISQDDWDTLIRSFKRTLKNKAKEQSWTKSDINLTFKSSLEEKGAAELLPVLWNSFIDILQFSSNDILLSFGKSIESVLNVVLNEAEAPLHFSEIARRAEPLLGREISDHNVNTRLQGTEAKLFGRGTYGLKRFIPISELICNHIRVVVRKIVYDGPLAKQWHVTELLNLLKEKFPSLPGELDMYLLNLILEDTDQLTYLNKNVWARADSGQKPTDRVDMADAFIKILEDAGKTLKGKEIKARLEAIRGVHESLQIQPTERMLQVGPDTWGLYERDVNINPENISQYLDSLYLYLEDKQKGIHVTEVGEFLNEVNLGLELPENYTLLSLAQRDERFHLGRSMFLGLAGWGEDNRRYTNAQAVRKILDEMVSPMNINEINARVYHLTGIVTETTVTGCLISEGAKYNKEQRLWFKE
tara:strand:- start:1755 stop:4538 length:2784 start_codon:yes stop_codon:yes gene_type:complete